MRIASVRGRIRVISVSFNSDQSHLTRITAPANSPAKAECTAIIRKMMTADSDYAGMVRYFVRVEWELNV